jgi:hypothetical protein
MGSITSRVERLELRHPPVIHRPAGETFDAFIARFCVALDGVAADQISSVMARWLAAARHDELHVLADALRASLDDQTEATQR